MPAMHSPAVQCCLCVVGVFIFLMGLIMFSIGICLILNFGVWENDLQISDFDTEEGKKKVGIILTCVGLLFMFVSVFVSLFYLCRGKKPQPRTIVPNQSKSGNNKTRNGHTSPVTAAPKSVDNLKEKHVAPRYPTGPYSRPFTKPHKKVHQKRKIRQAPRLDKIQEATSRKASEADLPMAVYDDERPESQGSHSTQTRTDTVDSDLASLTTDPTNTSILPPIRIPIIKTTTPSEHDAHSAHNDMASDSNEDSDDVFNGPPPSEQTLRTISVRPVTPIFDSYNSSMATNSSISNTEIHNVESDKNLPDIENVFHQQEIHQPYALTQREIHEPLSLHNQESDVTLQTSQASEHFSSAIEINPIYPTETEGKVQSWFDNYSEQILPFQNSDRLHSQNSEDVLSINSKGTDEERKEWYLGQENQLSELSDDSISRTNKNSLLGDNTLNKNIEENAYSQEFIPAD